MSTETPNTSTIDYKPSSAVLTLLKQWQQQRDVAEATRDALKLLAISEYPFRIGDKVEIRNRQGKSKIGRVTGISFADYSNTIILKPIVYPIKKNGETASVGQIYIWTGGGETITVIERAADELQAAEEAAR